MSAYGAYGYGLHGYGYRQILHHYFRGIRIDEAKRRAAGDACCSRSAPATSPSAGRRRPAGARSTPRAPTAPTAAAPRCGCSRARASCSPAAASACTPEGGGWSGSPASASTAARSRPCRPPRRPARSTWSTGSTSNNYARGSVPGEVPPEWPTATLKAFAVAIRSIALSTDVGGNGFDLYSDTRTQVYGGVEAGERAHRRGRARDPRARSRPTAATSPRRPTSPPPAGAPSRGFLGAPEVPYLRERRRSLRLLLAAAQLDLPLLPGRDERPARALRRRRACAASG